MNSSTPSSLPAVGQEAVVSTPAMSSHPQRYRYTLFPSSTALIPDVGSTPARLIRMPALSNLRNMYNRTLPITSTDHETECSSKNDIYNSRDEQAFGAISEGRIENEQGRSIDIFEAQRKYNPSNVGAELQFEDMSSAVLAEPPTRRIALPTRSKSVTASPSKNPLRKSRRSFGGYEKVEEEQSEDATPLAQTKHSRDATFSAYKMREVLPVLVPKDLDFPVAGAGLIPSSTRLSRLPSLLLRSPSRLFNSASLSQKIKFSKRNPVTISSADPFTGGPPPERAADSGFPIPYFLYGRLSDPRELQRIFKLSEEPVVRAAKLRGFERVPMGMACTVRPCNSQALSMLGPKEGSVGGILYMVRSHEEEYALLAHVDPRYRLIDVKIALESRGFNRGKKIQGKTFAADTKEKPHVDYKNKSMESLTRRREEEFRLARWLMDMPWTRSESTSPGLTETTDGDEHDDYGTSRIVSPVEIYTRNSRTGPAAVIHRAPTTPRYPWAGYSIDLDAVNARLEALPVHVDHCPKEHMRQSVQRHRDAALRKLEGLD